MHTVRIAPAVLGVLLLAAGTLAADERVTITNPTRRNYQNEPVRLRAALPKGAAANGVTVWVSSKPVPSQVSSEPGRAAELWVLATVAGGEAITCTVGKGKAPRTPTTLSLSRQAGALVLDNGLLAVRLPASAQAGKAPPCPIQAVRLQGSTWVGKGFWHAGRALTKFSATVLGQGPVFVKARLRYEFEGTAGLWGNVPAFAEVDVTLFPGQRHAVVEERHEMGPGDYWELDCAAGWSPRYAQCAPHSGGFDRPDLGPWPPNTLKTGQTRMGDVLLNLMPRWTQAYDEGWLFACHNGASALGALVCRAGEWHWPHNNMIQARVKPSADYAGLRCPTWKGRRYWFLIAGPAATWADKARKSYVTRYAFEPLDKLANDYTLDWPGLDVLLHNADPGHTPKLGGFVGKDFYSSGMNPTGAIRGFGKRCLRETDKPGNLGTLSEVQVLLDDDCYGSYWNFWSPENPNFHTDFIQGPVAMVARLKGHPRFAELARLARRKLHTDLYHSITLPGGAGQECPGYVAYAMKHWQVLAPICKEHLGFDPTAWPRYKAGAGFLWHVSQPLGGGRRRCHPGGDTHPPGPNVEAIAKEFGTWEDPKRFRTEELPGFGVVFRNRPGTDRETFLAFKSGPNRGHYHGDQLSFHYCAAAAPLAVDHMCSYAPRAGAEHMHNRLAFFTDKLPYANMDGYERVIAFKTSADADVAVGQVESRRLRVTVKYPPELWDTYLPEQRLDKPLTYRRTIVSMKNAGADYFVIRDQYAGPPVRAAWCLHVLARACERGGRIISLGRLSVFVAAPAEFKLVRHDWTFEKKDRRSGDLIFREATKGVRLETAGAAGEYITVLYPAPRPPKMQAVPGGVRVGDDEIVFAGGLDDADATAYVIARRGGKEILRLTGKDVDPNRSQGEVGLFVPDAGYPFGRIPDWLIRQRAKVPDWAGPAAREARRYERKP